MMYTLFFFFSSRRRHTRYIGDWSSDVCSSDLARADGAHHRIHDERADIGDRGGQHAGREREEPERHGERTVGAPHQLERAPAVTEDAEKAAQRERLAGSARGARRARGMRRRGHQEACSSARAANSPPKPQPTITIRALPAPCNAPSALPWQPQPMWG